MKDEIKEIKDNLKINEYLDLIKEDKNLSMGYVSLAQYIYELEDYITNLQEENERLKIEKQEEYNRFNLMAKFRDKALERALIYKSRNEKAVDEIQQLIDCVNNRTIIGLKNFIPKLEEIQDKLAGGDDSA